MSFSLKRFVHSPIFLPFVSVVVFAVAFGLYSSRLTEFHFVDEINNIVVGYFIMKGRALFTEIFFNHQMLTADISYLIQSILHPDSIYRLILFHRIFVLAFSLFMDILLIVRFRWKAIGFVLFFETFKYYLFGNLFLAESLIAQPLVYLFGLTLEGIDKKRISFIDLIAGGLFAWFIIFMREPFIPIAVLLFTSLFFFKNTIKSKLISFILFSILSVIMLFSVNIKDYIFQLFTVNKGMIFADVKQAQLLSVSGIRAFLYPFTLFLDKNLTFFRVILIFISANIIAIASWFIYKQKLILQLGVIFISLGLANIRSVSSDTQFYAGFHMIPWFALFCFSLYFLVEKLYLAHLKTALIFVGCSIISFVFLISSPSFYIHQKFNIEKTFTTDYGNYYSIGQVIKLLSDPKDTVFIEGYDSLIYWQADLPTAYKFAFYLPVMQSAQIYVQARNDMFNYHLPTFYYIDCGKMEKTNAITDQISIKYSQLIFAKKTQCLYVKKNKIQNITKGQSESLQKLGYSF